MKLIKPDYSRRVEIAGVPEPVRRPVDIDQAITGFNKLRTLRIYQFDKASVIEGHAEEDEVLLFVLAGSISLNITEEPLKDQIEATLCAIDGGESVAYAAYLPPGSGYRLIALSDAEVAYARATPVSSRPAKVFASSVGGDDGEARPFMGKITYAERLGLRLVRLDGQLGDLAVPIVEDEGGDESGTQAENDCETLLHLSALPPSTGPATISMGDGAISPVDPGDTVAMAPGERATLKVSARSAMLAVIVSAN